MANRENTFCTLSDRHEGCTGISRLGLFSKQETGLLAACGAYVTVSNAVLL